MLLVLSDVLRPEAARALRERILAADWVDGNATSGEGSARAKRNRQLPEASPAARDAQDEVTRALAANALFLSAALPHTIFPPLFNRYGAGDAFGLHIDNAVRIHGPSGTRIRTDLSATLFLTDPGDYDGGALTIDGAFGQVTHKLPAGSLLLYPSGSLHRVERVTRGERVSSFFWIQSLVRDEGVRELLFDLDQSVQALTLDRGAEDAEVLRLTRVYHNLMRRSCA